MISRLMCSSPVKGFELVDSQDLRHEIGVVGLADVGHISLMDADYAFLGQSFHPTKIPYVNTNLLILQAYDQSLLLYLSK